MPFKLLMKSANRYINYVYLNTCFTKISVKHFQPKISAIQKFKHAFKELK